MLNTILPRKGLVAIWGLDLMGRGTQQRCPRPVWLDTVAVSTETIAAASQSILANGATDVYFTLAAFEFKPGQPKQRRASYAKYIRSYGIDLDAHGGANQYSSPQEAYTHLLEVSSNLGIPPTLVVCTGRGIQAFWSTDKDMGVAEWQTLSETFYSILVAYGLKLDRAVQGDRARVFRLPGSFNSRAGTNAYVVMSGQVHEKRALLRRLKRICEEQGIVPAPAVVNYTPRASVNAQDATVYSHPDNQKRLEALASKLPPVYDDDTESGKCGYELWRDTIWGIKRTGLPNAWQVALDYARRSEGVYDDWFESFQRTWDSDKRNGGSDITVGTLVYLARRYGSGMDRGKFSRLRFLTQEDVEEEETFALLTRGAEIYTTAGELSDGDIEDADPNIEEDIQAPSPSIQNNTVAPVPSQDRNDWITGVEMASPAPIIFPPDDRGAGIGGPGCRRLPSGIKWDKEGRGCLFKKPREGDDPTDFDEEAGLDPVVDAPIAYLGREQNRTTVEGAKSQGFDVLRVYDVTGRWQVLHVPMCDMENPQELLKLVKGHGGEICAKGQKGVKLVSYLNLLSKEFRRTRGASADLVEQAGWYSPQEEDEDNNPVAFLLGSKVIKRTGTEVNVQMQEGAEQANKYFGDQRGTLHGQMDILNCYSGDSEGAMVSKIFCSWMLGTVLGQFLPQKQAVPYLYSNRGGQGKTAMAAVAFGLWGNGTYLTVSPESTKAAFLQYPSRRGALPTFLDDVTRGSRFSLEDYKNIILTSTQRMEGAASSSTGRSLIRGTLKLKGAITMSGNIPTSLLLNDSGPSVEASYRRLCLIRWHVMPAYDGTIPIAKRPPRPTVDGMELGEAAMTHFGHIGPMFVQWVLDNFALVKAEVNSQYRRLLDIAYQDPSSRGTHMTFICATAACARMGALFLHKYGLTPGWDIDSLLDRIDRMGSDTRDEVDGLYSMEPGNLWSRILEEAQGRTIDVPVSGKVLPQDVAPGLMARGGPIIRLDRQSGYAYMSVAHARNVVINNSCDWHDMERWITRHYQAEQVYTTLARDIPGALQTQVKCFAIPIDLVAPAIKAQESTAASAAIAPRSGIPPAPGL